MIMQNAWGLKFFSRVAILMAFLIAIVVGVVFFKWQIHNIKKPNLRDEYILQRSTTKVWKQLKKPEEPKLVLFYTKLFGRTPWPTIENDYEFNNWNTVPCKVRNCKISYDKKDLNKSDAVLFHGQDIDNINLSQLSKRVKDRAKQRWIFFIHENPEFFTKDFITLENVFNWTMTYKLNSDIFVPYWYYFPKTGKKLEDNLQDYSQGKDRLVAWMVSHCGKQRDKLVKKLMQYIPVHIYGGCAKRFSQNGKCNRWDKNCPKTLRRYKFYLAFENANCVDYISEKYWIISLQNSIVPVVLGGANYSNDNLAIPASYINAMDFASVKELADYLVMLDKNDTAYNEYFSWRKMYYVDAPLSWTCQLCSMLNNASIPIKIYDLEHFTKFWGIKNNCRFLDERVNRIISGYTESNTSNTTAV